MADQDRYRRDNRRPRRSAGSTQRSYNDYSGRSGYSSPQTNTAVSPERQARARARARAQARARARTRARIRMVLYLAVFAVAVLVLVVAIKDNKSPEISMQDTTQAADTTLPPETTAPIVTAPPVQTSWAPAVFTAEDAALNSSREITRVEIDYESLLLKPLNWDLTESDAKVLIIHSHLSEAYTQMEGNEYVEIGEYRSDDKAHNMACIGQRVTEILETHGVTVIHDTTDFEVPNTDYAYQVAREDLQAHIQNDPNIVLVIDLHRDAALTEEGTQWGPTVMVGDKEVARISFAIGTNSRNGGNDHWEDNLAITLKLQAQLEKLYPGITRQILVGSSGYNQDLSNNFMLVEVGAAGNTRTEALLAAECLANAILEISGGANCT